MVNDKWKILLSGHKLYLYRDHSLPTAYYFVLASLRFYKRAVLAALNFMRGARSSHRKGSFSLARFFSFQQ